MSTFTAGRARWQYPPPQTPRILHLPRRSRRRVAKPPTGKPASGAAKRELRGKLETLFDQERTFTKNVPQVLLDHGEDSNRKRDRVAKSDVGRGSTSSTSGLVVEEEKWRFQVEILRAECNLLRMEKEISAKKLERTRAQMQRALRSAIQTLVSGRMRICDGNNVGIVLEEEMRKLTEKLEKLQRKWCKKNAEARKYSNFDKQTSILQRRLQKFGVPKNAVCVKQTQEIAESIMAEENLLSSGKLNVEILRRKMEGLSKGILLERMEEEYNSMLSPVNSSGARSASNSKRIQISDKFSIHQPPQEAVNCEENVCSGRCKAVVRRIVEQVRAETEQWSQMQVMLAQVRDEIEELQVSRDIWEERALNSDFQIQSLHNAVQEWRGKSIAAENDANELQAKLAVLHGEFENLRQEQKSQVSANTAPVSLNTQNEMEKRVLVCRLKENIHSNDSDDKHYDALKEERRKPQIAVAPNRLAFRDIGNSSLWKRQHSKSMSSSNSRLGLVLANSLPSSG